MRLCLIILSLYTLVLTAVPCCSEEECVDNAQSHSEEHEGDNCTNCSPFIACGACTGFTLNSFEAMVIFEGIVSFPEEFKNIYPIDFFITFDLTSKIWQPPQYA